MKAFTRIAAAAALATATGATLAAAPTDGIYECTSPVVARVYMALNGQPNGATIATIPAVVPNQSVYGYAVGKIIGSNFSGQMSNGLSFNLNFNVAGDQFSGTAGLYFGNVPTNVAVSCTKIW